MSMLLHPIRHLHHLPQQRRLICRPQGSLRSDKNLQRISYRLQSITDDHGAEDMAAGFIHSFTDHADESLNQQLCDSSLPGFLQDQLRDTVKHNCSISNIPVSLDCRSKTDSLCMEFLPLQNRQTSTSLKETIAVENQQSIAIMINTLQNSWSWQRTLNFIYEKLVFSLIGSGDPQEVNEKTINWLVVISGSIAAIQTQFLQAAMDNLNTMQESVSFSNKSQETLDAMTCDERDCYIKLRDSRRRKFITAQTHYRSNLHLFRHATQMLNTLFSLFSKPCRFRAS
ncbi:MAG: hypothetical protein JAY85_09355 [Candidatus Thiodiazotropha weberae]|uniref:Uncharacterized protein n=1 Tax=Candidatus Thiodiazotropha endoloripes TaxID=1818881 RepID=A0A1E2ULG8_9GAMM|nr:hypothetical protein [Candidatus Thiodiazotropha endoloripes]MCG7898649.1 hypothetical protein [Candidatus Thiodiazotropha weberae]ODB95596.1 hypothetical protein A3196_01800 [Candidatus Thiodiazotropha endoloripes]